MIVAQDEFWNQLTLARGVAPCWQGCSLTSFCSACVHPPSVRQGWLARWLPRGGSPPRSSCIRLVQAWSFWRGKCLQSLMLFEERRRHDWQLHFISMCVGGLSGLVNHSVQGGRRRVWTFAQRSRFVGLFWLSSCVVVWVHWLGFGFGMPSSVTDVRFLDGNFRCALYCSSLRVNLSRSSEFR